ncbi:LysM peptidoglycan-binding domain-containing protein [Leucobacter sp. wl10]|nr:LysM peptidoglycan-binding domain-containing protein [Leucobacter sp. wl10]
MAPRTGEGAAVSDASVAGARRLRLTRRGRVVFGGVATVLVAGLLAFLAAIGAPRAIASDSGSSQQFQYVVVQPGSSLWEVATQLDPSADPRDLVAEIVQLNQLDDSGVVAGQPLAVPMRYAESPVTVPEDQLGI